MQSFIFSIISSVTTVTLIKSSRPQQWKKAEEKLQKELLEAEASESKDKKIKLVSLGWRARV